jgi:uncharacterized membrane protein required for colicin V production
VNVAGFLATVSIVDLLIVVGLFAFFVLGYIQGAVRRLIGIASMTFSFFLAAQLQVPVGSFLAENWTQYPHEYSSMVAFLTIFVAAMVAFALVTQGTYSKTEIFSQHPIVDEVVGGILGFVQGALLLLFVTIILDQFFLFAIVPAQPGEIPFARAIWLAIDSSQTGHILHTTVIPNFLAVVSFLIPHEILVRYGIE